MVKIEAIANRIGKLENLITSTYVTPELTTIQSVVDSLAKYQTVDFYHPRVQVALDGIVAGFLFTAVQAAHDMSAALRVRATGTYKFFMKVKSTGAEALDLTVNVGVLPSATDKLNAEVINVAGGFNDLKTSVGTFTCTAGDRLNFRLQQGTASTTYIILYDMGIVMQ